MAQIGTAGVVGLGTMGAGIVEVLAKAGVAVVGVEIDEAALERGRSILDRSLSRAVERGKLDAADRDAVDARITWTTDFATLAEADLVIEAVPERMDIKRDLFGRLDSLCKPTTVLATNTSSLSVTEIAATTSRPDRVVGMHFFNPAPAMKLVEVIRTVLTDDDVVGGIEDLARAMGKTPVTVGDRAGFVANTLLIAYLNDAVRVFDATSVSREDLDAAMSLGAGLPMGPLALCDLIGLDVVLEVMDVLFAESRDPFHAPAPLLRTMVAAGLLGRKSGRGFYTYAAPGKGTVVDDAATPAPAAIDASVTHVVVVGTGGHADDLVAGATAAGLTVEQVAADAFDPGTVPDGAAVVVDVSPLQRVRDVAAVLDVERRGSAIGMHTLHRGPKGLAVEVARTPFTTAAAEGAALRIVEGLEGTAVRCDDTAGLVVGRLLTAYLNDAARMLASGYADADAIDAAMMLGCGYPVGPIAFLDRMGAATVVATLDAVHAETRIARHAAEPLLRDAAAYGCTPRELVGRR